jgi:rRNA maturation endonuclease Nob1
MGMSKRSTRIRTVRVFRCIKCRNLFDVLPEACPACGGTTFDPAKVRD